MLHYNLLVLLSLTDFVLSASLQNSLRGLDEKEPSLKPLRSATTAVAQEQEEDLTHTLQRFGSNFVTDLASKVQGHLSSKDEPVYDAPLRKFGDDAKKKNDTESATKQENSLPAVPVGIGDAISEREKHATANAPGAGGEAQYKIPGENTNPVPPDAGKKRSAMEKTEEETDRTWGQYGKEKWEEIKEGIGWGGKEEAKAKVAGEKIEGAEDPDHVMVPVPKEAPETETAPTIPPEPEVAPTEAPKAVEDAVPEAPPQKDDAPIAEPSGTGAGVDPEMAVTLPPEMGLPEDEAVSGADKKKTATGNGLPTGRGGARMAQPWIFSLMMIGILVCFCCGVCAFARYAKNSFRKTEDELYELLEEMKSTSMHDLMNKHAYGTPTPVPILRARHLTKKARDDQEDAKREHRISQYNAVRQAILDESYKMRVGKTKEELQVMDEEIRMKLRIEKEKIRASTIKDWAEGTLKDPVPSLPEVEAWLAKMEKRWQELQMQST